MSARKDRRDLRKETMWRELVRQQGRSGETVREFCRQKRLSEASFYAWRRELKLRRQESEPRRAAEPLPRPTFVPVALADPPATAAIELVLPSGVVLRLPATTDLPRVAALVADLERRAC